MKSAPARLRTVSCSSATAGPSIQPGRGGRLDHGELATHVVGGQRHRDRRAHGGQHVERRHGRLDHDHVGALGHVLRDLGQRLAPVARVLLVGPAVAAAGDGDVDRVAEGAVERGGVLRRVGQDGRPGRGRRRRARHGWRPPGRPSCRWAPPRRRRPRPAPARCAGTARASASLSTSPSGPRTPQWPWSVYSSRQRSAMRTSSSPTASRTARSATCTTPSGSQAPLPCASLRAGTPKRISPGTPSETRRLASTTSESSVCCTSPGMDAIGTGSVDPLPHEERGDQVVRPEPGLGHQPPQRRRAAQPAQPPHGEPARSGRRRRLGHRSSLRAVGAPGPKSPISSSTMPCADAPQASCTSASPAARAAAAVVGPMQTTWAGGATGGPSAVRRARNACTDEVAVKVRASAAATRSSSAGSGAARATVR